MKASLYCLGKIIWKITSSHSFGTFFNLFPFPPHNSNLMKRGDKPEKMTVVSKMLITAR